MRHCFLALMTLGRLDAMGDIGNVPRSYDTIQKRWEPVAPKLDLVLCPYQEKHQTTSKSATQPSIAKAPNNPQLCNITIYNQTKRFILKDDEGGSEFGCIKPARDQRTRRKKKCNPTRNNKKQGSWINSLHHIIPLLRKLKKLFIS